MAKETPVTTIEQRIVEFYGDELIAVRADDGHIYVSVRHLCEAIGVARQGQVRRIKDNHVLAKGYTGGNITLPPGPSGGGGSQKANLLRVDLVPLWLTGIDTRRVREEIRSKLERYQEEVAKVLWEAFQEGRLTTDDNFEDLLANSASDAVEAYKMALAVVKLARNQIVLESRLDKQDNRLDNYEERLGEIEATLGDTKRAVTPDQASQISQAVKAVAIAQGKVSGRNEFGAVYGEMYRKFGITSYKALPAAKFDEALKWLTDWFEELGGERPF